MTPRSLVTQSSLLNKGAGARPAQNPVSIGGEIPALIDELGRLRIVAEAVLIQFCRQEAARLRDSQTRERFCTALVEANLITQYQFGRIVAKQSASLVFGNYLLKERLAAGTVGVVFRAEHRTLRRHVAIKMLNADDETPAVVVERFHHEGLLLGQVSHPNVVAILDAGTAPSVDPTKKDTHYLALEFVDGTDVEEYVYAKEQPLDVEETCDLMSQVAWGLGAIHEKGILHRDIKPSNLLISKKGDVKIVDFGIGLDSKNKIDYGESLLGSLDFMPLEQSVDAGHATPASDIYALGVSCFWLLTGNTPLPQGKSVEEALKIIREAPFRNIRQFCKDVPPELEGSIMRMLERDPRRRLSSARDAALLLERFSRRRLLTSTAEEVAGPASAALSAPGNSLAGTAGKEEAVYQALLAALEIKDQCGPQRGKRLTESITELIRALQKREFWIKQIDTPTLVALNWAVRLLDVGALFTSERVAAGKALMTREEIELQKNHPIAGSNFLERVVHEVDPKPVYLKAIRQIVEAHHERHDGTGTPNGTKGDDIAPAARVAALLDAYEDLRRNRKTKVGMGHEEALRSIILNRAVHFDPWVLIAFQECEAKISSIYANYADPPV